MQSFIFRELESDKLVKIRAKDIKDAIKKINKLYPGKFFVIELDEKLGDSLVHESCKK